MGLIMYSASNIKYKIITYNAEVETGEKEMRLAKEQGINKRSAIFHQLKLPFFNYNSEVKSDRHEACLRFDNLGDFILTIRRR